MSLVAKHSSGIFHVMHIYTHPEFIHHDVAEGHPERPDRLRHLLGHLDREGILDDCQLREPRDLSDAQILAAHTIGHLEFLRRSEPTDGIVPIDPDTWMGPRSLNAARLAASAVCSGVEPPLLGTLTGRPSLISQRMSGI